MLLLTLLEYLSLLLLSHLATAATANVADIFRRPVYARIYNGGQFSLANADRSTGDRVNISRAASAIAGLRPTYVCSLIYLSNGNNLTETMVNDFNTVRSAVHAISPTAKFDIEISLQSDPPDGNPFPSAAALVSFMQQVDSKLQLDGWWFDFYSNAQKTSPDWITAAAEYAHNRSQTIGGNVFGNVVPPQSDAVSFVDNPDTNTTFGFGFSVKEVNALKSNSPSTAILGHLQSNPQNGNTTESCVYMNDWNSTRRAYYQDYWVLQQENVGFTYMFPVFFPLCPGAYSFDPLDDELSNGNALPLVEGDNEVLADNITTLYDYIQLLALGNSTENTTAATSSPSMTATTRTSDSARARDSCGIFVAAAVGFVACVLIVYSG